MVMVEEEGVMLEEEPVPEKEGVPERKVVEPVDRETSAGEGSSCKAASAGDERAPARDHAPAEGPAAGHEHAPAHRHSATETATAEPATEMHSATTESAVHAAESTTESAVHAAESATSHSAATKCHGRGWKGNRRAEDGYGDVTEELTFHGADPPPYHVGCRAMPPQARITTATSAGWNLDKQLS
jgi:hypothetical protein